VAHRTCPYCGKSFKRLDRHLNGRVGCALQRRQAAKAMAGDVDLHGDQAQEQRQDEQDVEAQATPTTPVRAADGKLDYVGVDGRRHPRAFDPAAVPGGQPHRQGVEPTPVHPDDPPTGAEPTLAGKRKNRRQGGNT
jgi:hypothetical protein